ncbi:EamA family transporter [Candidatus Aerophobetes bacterium]|uniref:EamA family transporter n=1 Tax=Aerophobetes bacterium TaxID=2030807 RepID=A0A2A4YIE3_UNCAE|nr:MAG: EamA family transporter [Candidatus Aerophobetes bacterium]
MEENAHKPAKSLSLILLWISILMFSAANSIIAKLGLLGAHHLKNGRNPISFCNILFVANIIAGIVLFIIHRKSWKKQTLSTIPQKSWWLMLFLAVISGVIAPSLFFIGLMLTKVINVVLISTLDVPLTLFFAWLILKEKPRIGTVIAALITIAGIIITFILHAKNPMDMEMRMTMANVGKGSLGHFFATVPKIGEICIAVATFFTIFSVEFGRKVLRQVPTGIFSVFRMIAGAVIFFIIVLSVFGWVHFADVFSPYLWGWMLVYGGGIIAFGLFLWYRAMQNTNASDLSTANSVQPVTGIFFAYLILSEIPDSGQITGGIVIIVGIGIGLAATLIAQKKQRELETLPKEEKFSPKKSQSYIGL